MVSQPQGPTKHFPTIWGLMLSSTQHPVPFLAQPPAEISKNSSSKRRSLSWFQQCCRCWIRRSLKNRTFCRSLKRGSGIVCTVLHSQIEQERIDGEDWMGNCSTGHTSCRRPFPPKKPSFLPVYVTHIPRGSLVPTHLVRDLASLSQCKREASPTYSSPLTFISSWVLKV